MQIILYDGIYIPAEVVDIEAVKKRFSRQLFDDRSCESCESFQDRFSYLCAQCPAYKGKFTLHKTVKIGGEEHVSIPRGAMAELQKFSTLGIVDKRKKPLLPEGLAITSPLWPHQRQAIRDVVGNCSWSDEKGTYVSSILPDCNGIVKAPPRTGKTLIVLALAVSLGLKTLILAHQDDLLKQFIEDIEKHTNFKDVESFNGSPIYGVCKKIEDFDRFPIALSTYQQFITEKGQQRLNQIRKSFGSVFVDESHRSAANSYSKVVATIPARNRIGVTGTVERKDGMEFITADVVGTVLTSVHADSMRPTVFIHKTMIKPDRPYTMWVYAMQFLAKNTKRMNLLIKYVLRDLKLGRHIVIPVTFVHQTTTLSDRINEAYGEKVAMPFNSKSDRKDVIAGARTGKYRVVVGIRSIISTGINVPKWDCLYVIAAISNPPNFEQEVRRICTPAPGKKTPIIRHFVDDMGQSTGCFINCYWKTYMVLKFDIPEKTKQKAFAIMKASGRRMSRAEESHVNSSGSLDAPIKRNRLFSTVIT